MSYDNLDFLVDSSAHDFTVLHLILDRARNTVYFKRQVLQNMNKNLNIYMYNTQTFCSPLLCHTLQTTTATSPISDPVAKFYFHEIIF